MLEPSMTVRPVKLTLCLTGSYTDCVYINTSPCVSSSAMYFTIYTWGGFAPPYKYMVKYMALLDTEGLVFM